MQEMIRQILGAAGQYERAMIRLRLRSGKQRKKAQGGFIGGQVPYGWETVNGELQEISSEQEALSLVRELQASGASYRAIVGELDAGGFSPKRSSRWHPNTVRLILERGNASIALQHSDGL